MFSALLVALALIFGSPAYVINQSGPESDATNPGVEQVVPDESSGGTR